MYVTFSLKSIELEAAEKVASMVEYSDTCEHELLELSARKFDQAQVEKIRNTLSFARSLESNSPGHTSMRTYLSHPIRVARISLQLQTVPDVQTVVLGLLHNVFEVTGISEMDLVNAGYEEKTAHGIRLLTIDRNHQYDEDYLGSFYADIERFGKDLVLIKSIDRLDNLLAFQLIERTPRIERYIDLSDRFVTPMSERLSVELGEYHSNVIDYMRRVGCDPVLKSKYDAFIAKAAHS